VLNALVPGDLRCIPAVELSGPLLEVVIDPGTADLHGAWCIDVLIDDIGGGGEQRNRIYCSPNADLLLRPTP
jgi:hypothetical protein